MARSAATLMEFGAPLVPTSSSSSRVMTLASSSAMRATTKPSTTNGPTTSTGLAAFDEEIEDGDDARVSPSTADSSSIDVPGDANTAAAAELAFDASKYFQFGAGFGPTGDDIFASTADEFADESNNTILPAPAVSPTNQQRDDAPHTPLSDELGMDMATPHKAGQASQARAIHSNVAANRRKNSIEMFLSQSPSQALGGEFLKMSLDDHRVTRRGGEHVHPPIPRVTPDLEREPTPDRSKAEAYRGYLPSPAAPVEMDKEWNTRDGSTTVAPMASPRGYYYEQPQQAMQPQAPPHLGRYYGSGATAGPTLFRQSSLDPYALSPTHQEMANPSSQWQHSGGAYGGAMPTASGYPQQVHSQYPSQQYPNQPMRPSGNRAFVRSQSMGGSGRFSSRSASLGMLEASPPQSPRHPLNMSGSSNVLYGNVGTKQCKFFLQGHCRMGNKCKFAHQSTSSMMYAQSVPPHASSFTHPSFATPSAAPVPPHGHGLPMQMAEHEMPHHHLGAFTRSSSARSLGGSYRMNEMQQVIGGPAHLSAHGAGAHNAGMHGGFVNSETVLQPEDVQGRVFAMSKDQNGCRLLQEQLEYCDERKTLCDVIYREAMEHLAEMMVDPFGNYLFQKLLERAKPLQRLEIIRRVSGNLVAAALNLHGTRSVQKVVEVCASSAEVVELDSDGHELRRVSLPDVLVDALKDDAVRLCIDSNGNHVIQRALQYMKPEYNQFVFDAVCLECTTVGTHRHGCCVLQRCLDAADAQQKQDVIQQVEKQAMKLMQDPYGNYVVQYVLDSCDPEEARGVIVKPLGSIYDLSIQKFSSNVIEKCLEKAPGNVLVQYIDEITTCPRLQKMLQDQFANYVVQRALCVAPEDQCLALVQAIRPHLSAMRNTSGGRRITARILKRFPHMDLSMELGYESALPGLLMRSNTTGTMGAPSMFGTSGLTYAPNPLGLGLHSAGGGVSQL